jgi:uncharacterized protein YoaH (UPF0181 family)
MMGPKKLSTVRKELRQSLGKKGKDPIQWLDERIRALERAGNSTGEATEVLQALRRVLQSPTKTRHRTPTPSGK